jgi:sterol desaturase/sphingolipid hydroxylase (fatty acid hydroxylase superfamily)
MHHMDLDVDFTTGIRFHPVEIVLSVLIKFAVVLALGAPVAAVVIFEILLNGSSMFNHGNVRLARGIDRTLRAFLVTPDMHRVHHSVVRAETDSNFGFCLSFWDRVFRTYRDQPAAGHDGMTVGLPRFREAGDQGFIALLTNPVRPGPAH